MYIFTQTSYLQNLDSYQNTYKAISLPLVAFSENKIVIFIKKKNGICTRVQIQIKVKSQF